MANINLVPVAMFPIAAAQWYLCISRPPNHNQPSQQNETHFSLVSLCPALRKYFKPPTCILQFGWALPQKFVTQLRQLKLAHLPAPRQGHGFGHALAAEPEDVCRRLVLSKLPPHPLSYLRGRRFPAITLWPEEGAYDLAVVSVLEPDHHCEADGWVRDEALLDFERV